MLLTKLAVACLLVGGAICAFPTSTTCKIEVYWTGAQLLVNCEGTCTTYPAGPCDDLVITDPVVGSILVCMCDDKFVATTCDKAWSIDGLFADCEPSCAETGKDCSTRDLPPMVMGTPWWAPEDAFLGC